MIRPFFRLRDLWVGVSVDSPDAAIDGRPLLKQMDGVVIVRPLPTIGLKIRFRRPRSKQSPMSPNRAYRQGLACGYNGKAAKEPVTGEKVYAAWCRGYRIGTAARKDMPPVTQRRQGRASTHQTA